jgi:hypothetical protein
MNNTKYFADGFESKDHLSKLDAIRNDLKRRFGGKFKRDATIIRFDYYESMGIEKSDLEMINSNKDLKNKELTYDNLLRVLAYKRTLKKKEHRKLKIEKRKEAKAAKALLPFSPSLELQKKRQREWSLRLKEVKERISIEVQGFTYSSTPLPRKFFYEFGLTDEDIESMKNHPKFKDDSALTWRNLLAASRLKKRELRGGLKKGEKYYFVKSEFRNRYGKYLASEKWKAKRLLVLERDDYFCQDCGVDLQGKLAHVHHLTYDRIFNEKLSDLQTLCPECHMKEHNLA